MRTEAQSAASRANLAKYREKNPSGPQLKHGAKSRPIRKTFSDKRTREGARLRDTLEGLKSEFGPLTPSQSIVLDRLKEKLITAALLGAYLDRQMEALVTPGGELATCARQAQNLSESIGRDISMLRDLAARRPKPPLAELLRQEVNDDDP